MTSPLARITEPASPTPSPLRVAPSANSFISVMIPSQTISAAVDISGASRTCRTVPHRLAGTPYSRSPVTLTPTNRPHSGLIANGLAGRPAVARPMLDTPINTPISISGRVSLVGAGGLSPSRLASSTRAIGPCRNNRVNACRVDSVISGRDPGAVVGMGQSLNDFVPR